MCLDLFNLTLNDPKLGGGDGLMSQLRFGSRRIGQQDDSDSGSVRTRHVGVIAVTKVMPRVILLMGVMGSGKTTVGRLLAQRLNWSFEDADTYHPQSNIDKMARGVALTDFDRRPWLRTLSDVIDAWLGVEDAGFESFDQDAGLVLACSALKQAYREILVGQKPGVQIVFLQGSEAVLQARLSLREHAFMPKALLHSQLATLEAPKAGLTLDIANPPEALVAQICAALLA